MKAKFSTLRLPRAIKLGLRLTTFFSRAGVILIRILYISCMPKAKDTVSVQLKVPGSTVKNMTLVYEYEPIKRGQTACGCLKFASLIKKRCTPNVFLPINTGFQC